MPCPTTCCVGSAWKAAGRTRRIPGIGQGAKPVGFALIMKVLCKMRVLKTGTLGVILNYLTNIYSIGWRMGMDEEKLLKAFTAMETKLSARMTSLETKVDGMAGQLKLNCSKLDDMQANMGKMQKDMDSLKD